MLVCADEVQNTPQDCLVLVGTYDVSNEHYWPSLPSLLCLIHNPPSQLQRDVHWTHGSTLAFTFVP